jgi:hypothetical protein
MRTPPSTDQPEGTVKSRLHRARAALAEIIASSKGSERRWTRRRQGWLTRKPRLFAPMVDHELAPTRRPSSKSHHEPCPECQHGFEKYSRAVSLVRSVGRERAPAEFTSRCSSASASGAAGTGCRSSRAWACLPAGIAVLIAAAIAAVGGAAAK